MDKGDLPHSEYYEAVGRGISAWQLFEDKLTSLFSRLLICAFHGTMLHSTFEQLWIAGNILNSITNVNTKIDLIDATFTRLVKDDDLGREWIALKNKIKEKYKLRNALAHGLVWGNDESLSFLGSPMFSSRQKRYSAIQVKTWESSFLGLAERTESFAIVVNRYLVANPLPLLPRPEGPNSL